MVVGKYLAALVFYLFLWLPTVVYAVILSRYSEVDWGPVASGYLGIAGIGALLLAAGVLASSLSRSQLVAAVLTFAIARAAVRRRFPRVPLHRRRLAARSSPT